VSGVGSIEAMGTKTLLTLEQFLRLPGDGMQHELNRGELVSTPPPSLQHARIASRIAQALADYVKGKRMGEVLVEAGYRLRGGEAPIVRQPDVSFVSAARIRHADQDGWIEGAPELAVEVVSPANTAQDLEDKIEQYLAFGAKVVWVIYPKQRRVRVYRSGGGQTVLDDTSDITEPGLFPGISIPVREILG
jgi:Uma2 family endonuclease